MWGVGVIGVLSVESYNYYLLFTQGVVCSWAHLPMQW